MRKRRLLALLMAVLLTVLPGCAEQKSVSDRVGEASERTEPNISPSPEALREEMEGTGQLFAVAYFGYHDTVDSEISVDPIKAVREQAPKLCRQHPFLTEIPADRTVGERGDLFCIVPLDPDAAVMLCGGFWDDEALELVYEDVVYSSDRGEPFFLFCNGAGWEPDIQLHIFGPSGGAVWYPCTDDMQCVKPLCDEEGDFLLYDFSPYRELLEADHRDMKGEWTLPAADMLAGTTWVWKGYRKDGADGAYQVTFHEDTLTARWNDGTEAHAYSEAPWELAYEKDYAVLSVDLGEMAGILRYDLLYHEDYEELYFGMDVLQKEMPIGWEPLSRFLRLSAAPEPGALAGTWELSWTEIEGEQVGAAPGEQIIRITEAGEDLFRIDFTNNAFPERSFYGKELFVTPGEIFYGCGNDRWFATVDYTDMNGTEFTLTVLEDGMLMLRFYWETDGIPMVSHGYYQRK